MVARDKRQLKLNSRHIHLSLKAELYSQFDIFLKYFNAYLNRSNKVLR